MEVKLLLLLNVNYVWKRLNLPVNTYNYLVYTQLINFLDNITQLMIYHRQGDGDNFKSDKYDMRERFLALFLLRRKDEI